MTISGTTVTGGAVGKGVYNGSASCTINITAAVTGGGAASAYGAYNGSTGTIAITGDVTGGSNASAHGAYNGSTGTLSVVGTVTGSASTLAAGLYGANSGGVTTFTKAAYGTNGSSPTTGWVKMAVVSGNTITVKRSDTGADYVLSYGSGAVSVSPFKGGIG